MDKNEIRDILMGRLVKLDEDLWVAPPADARLPFPGFRDGALNVRFKGVTRQSCRFRLRETEVDALFEEAGQALHSMGRTIRLASAPEAPACLYAPNWIAPVLLTLTREGDIMTLTAYTGRGFLIDRFRCRTAFRILEKRLPGGISPMEEPQPTEAPKPEQKAAAGKKKSASKGKKK